MLDSNPPQWLPYGLPYHDILSLIAPRPLFEATGTKDPVNCNSKPPPASVDEFMRQKRQAHSQALTTYNLHGAGERLVRYEFDGGHEFPLQAREAAYAWLKRWLM